MEDIPRHQCLIYDGAPSRQLPVLAAALAQKLAAKYRCLYINSPPMVAGIRSSLAGSGIDVPHEIERGGLILTSERAHLVQGRFDPDRMIQMLQEMLDRALDDGYRGLWATGDMTWEFGPEKNFSKLLDYESRLEEVFRSHPSLGGICQYHADTLPREALRDSLIAHPALFVSETLARINPYYVADGGVQTGSAISSDLERALERFLAPPKPRSD